MKIPTLYCGGEDGEIIERELPSKWAICPQCRGDGRHSLRFGAMTRDELYEDPDFAEDYMRGYYDEPCNPCDGTGKIKEVDWDRLSDADKKAWKEQCEDEAAYRAEQRAERRMEMGRDALGWIDYD